MVEKIKIKWDLVGIVFKMLIGLNWIRINSAEGFYLIVVLMMEDCFLAYLMSLSQLHMLYGVKWEDDS